MKTFEKDGKLWFDCGCYFDIIGPPIGKSKIPRVRCCLDKHNPKNTINFECPATWETLSKGWTKGVFQLETEYLGGRWCKKLRPENKEHMAALGAILRPGCTQSKDTKIVCKNCAEEYRDIPEPSKFKICLACGGDKLKRETLSITDHYCLRKNGEERIVSYHPVVDKILNKSYNCLIYQEQAMLLARELAGFSLQDADMLRKAIGKKLPEEMAKVKVMFLEGCRKIRVISEKQAEEVFGWIEKSQRYSFNKSHAASYGETGYICAYAKTHFPIAFYTNWIGKEKEREEIKELVNDARVSSNIRILPPDIRFLNNKVHTDGERIYFGLQNIKGMGESKIIKLYEVIKHYGIHKEDIELIGWMTFMMYICNELPIDMVGGMINSGALSCFGTDRVVMSKDYEVWSKLTKTEKMSVKYHFLSRELNSINDIVIAIIRNKYYNRKDRLPILQNLLNEINNRPYQLVDTVDYLVHSEEELLGVSLTCHVTDALLTAQESHSCKDIANGYKGYAVLKVSLDQVNPWKCKNGKSAGKYMAFIKVSDNSCSLGNVVAFPEVYEKYSHLLSTGGIVYITGQISQQGSFTIERVYEHKE